MVDPKLPAFPAESTVIPISHNGGFTYYTGMDLRTYISSQVLSGILSNEHVSNISDPNSVIKLAVGYADRLITELNKEV